MLLGRFLEALVTGAFAGLAEARLRAADARAREELVRLAGSVAITAFLCFWGSFAAAGLAALQQGQDFWGALAWALFSGAGTMAVGVGIVWKRLAPKGWAWWVPRQLEEKLLEAEGTLTEKPKERGE